MDDPVGLGNIFHTLWTGIITVAGAIVAFFTKRLVDEVDQKADKAEVDTLREEFRAHMASQQQQHTDNTERLDRILVAVLNGNHR